MQNLRGKEAGQMKTCMNKYFHSLLLIQCKTNSIIETEPNMTYTNVKKYLSLFTCLPVFMRTSFSGKLFFLLVMGLAIPFFTAGITEKNPANPLQNTQWYRHYTNPEGNETDAYIQFTADKLYIWEKQRNCSCYVFNALRYKTENDKFYYWNSDVSGWASDEVFINETDHLIFLRKEIPRDSTTFTKDEFNASGWCVCR